ncbi:MAG: tRNA (uridine(34)/cytosine(34)/5-carboxymethylaminomethyluridine(34)-2'-O)-methyltransferase TrmL [Ruminococcus sp.]|nr:tRNA (uridine(34)/cytosine(34)/5-carboxymethylaminomethyluridine(34)-2'-O)-methyltransferase TrmL [Candidatus Copronaster equi]
MSVLNIVLVEPEIPQNTGNIARTCAATGARLHIVEPMGFKIDDKKLKRAGLDYWHLLDITYYKNLDDFFEKNKDGEYRFFTTKGLNRHSDVSYSDNVYLFFGKETKGLPEELLFEHPDECVRIPMINNSDARSLNLSNSVAVAVYEVLRQWDYPDLLCAGKLTKFSWEDKIGGV